MLPVARNRPNLISADVFFLSNFPYILLTQVNPEVDALGLFAKTIQNALKTETGENNVCGSLDRPVAVQSVKKNLTQHARAAACADQSGAKYKIPRLSKMHD